MSSAHISSAAVVDSSARIGEGTKIWDLAEIRENAVVGARCTIGRNVYVDHDVVIGDGCKIQNGALVYWPARIGDGVFLGPGVILTNDRTPRAVDRDLIPKQADAWDPAAVVIHNGASIGAGAIIVAGISIGAWAMVGAGSLVTKDVEPYSLVVGSPARQVGWVGTSGERLAEGHGGVFEDRATGERYRFKGRGLVPD